MDPNAPLPRPEASKRSDGPHPGTSRRAFLSEAAATATLAFLLSAGLVDPKRRGRVTPTPAGAAPRTLDARAWETLEAAQARILPSAEGSPGAAEVGAIGYLDAVLAEPDVEEGMPERILAGARRLDAFAKERGAASFAALRPDQQDAGIGEFEKDWESQLWLRGLLGFTLEAFLGDPADGADPGEVGWRWAGAEPGYPHPSGPWSPRGQGPAVDGAR